MPRKAPAAESESQTTEATPELSRGVKAQSIRDALKAHPRKAPKEIVALLKKQGLEVTNAAVSMAKFNMKGRAKKKAVPAPAPEAAAPVVPKDAVSIGLLQKAKKLAAQLGGIQAAKQAIDALAQILD